MVEAANLEPSPEIRPAWEVRGYKTFNEVTDAEEWEAYVEEAGEELDDGRFLGAMLTWQPDKPAREAARMAALRRRLARELQANSMVELLLVDVLVANYAMQADWWEVLGSRTHVLHRHVPTRRNAVEKVHLEELSDKVVPILDRLNRQFIRTTKMLRDLKASPIVVNVGRAEQVNVGAQQVIVAGPNTETATTE